MRGRIGPFRLDLLLTMLLVLGACSSDDGPDPGGGITLPPLEGDPVVIDNLHVVSGTAGSIVLSWTSPQLVTKATGGISYDLRYTLYSLIDSPIDNWATAFEPQRDASSGLTHTHTVSGLSEGQVYAIALRSSTDDENWSGFSNTVVATAADPWDTTAPAPITDLRFWSSSAHSITVHWSGSGDDGDLGSAVGYQIAVHSSPLDENNWGAAVEATADISFDPENQRWATTVTALTEGQKYYLGVKAVDEAGNYSSISNELEVVAGQSRTWYIKVDGTGDLPTIEAAVDVAGEGDEIVVAAGRYTWTNQGTGDFYGLILFARDHTGFTLRSEEGPEKTILDAEGLGGVIHIQGYNEVVIEGFTITRGNNDGQPDSTELYAGGGISSHLASPTIRNCIIKWNYATEGGGLWLGSTGQPRLENCIIENNEAQQGGGVALVNDALLTSISDCTIRNNNAVISGGGILGYNVLFTLENCLITGNTSGNRGGGITGSTLHDGCLVTGCTLVDNSATLGSALRLYGNFDLEVQSSIIAFNETGPAFSTDLTASLSMGCSDVFGHVHGQDFPSLFTDLGGNFFADPQFCNDTEYTLAASSPCAEGNHPDSQDCGLIGAGAVDCGATLK